MSLMLREGLRASEKLHLHSTFVAIEQGLGMSGPLDISGQQLIPGLASVAKSERGHGNCEPRRCGMGKCSHLCLDKETSYLKRDRIVLGYICALMPVCGLLGPVLTNGKQTRRAFVLSLSMNTLVWKNSRLHVRQCSAIFLPFSLNRSIFLKS